MSHEELRLESPQSKHEHQHQEMLNEFLNEWYEIAPRALRKRPHETFEQFLRRTEDRKNGKNLPAERVPSSLYFVIRWDGKMIWAVNIRHTLNEGLKNLWGHIGCGIRPSERHKWYANIILELAIEKCKKLEISDIIITCDKENITYSKAIAHNNWKLEKEYISKEHDNIMTQKRIISTI